MKQIINARDAVKTETWDRARAIAYYEQRGEPFKVELINRIPEGEDLRMYWHGDWQDLCRGPHLVHTGQVPADAKTIADHVNDEDCTGGSWAYVDIDLTKYDGRAKKLNITMPHFLLARIDDYFNSHREYHSRSGFLAELARRELAKHS